jgi:predicted N-acyltransferase
LIVEIATRTDIESSDHWGDVFAVNRKDHRYIELVEDTIHEGFDYGYFALKDDKGEVRAIQPYFINNQDLLEAASPRMQRLVALIRRLWPSFLRMRTLMIGCAVGEGHLDAADDATRFLVAENLAKAIDRLSRELRARLVVFKEFSESERPALACLLARGFSRIPSMPNTRLRLNYSSFEEYLCTTISRSTRSKLRRKFKASAQKAILMMEVVSDAAPYINEIYPLYSAVYERAKLKYLKLSPSYFREIGQRLPDKTRFFLWRDEGRIVAFNLCLTNRDSICSECVGFDYSVAFKLHLYYVVVRDIIEWAIAHKYKWFRSTALNYEPKYHLRYELEPLDLYVKHTQPLMNAMLKRVLHFLEPVRQDRQLKRFKNYKDLYA